jgi:hypothetical protein
LSAACLSVACEAREVLVVERHEDEVVRVSDGANLSVGEGRRPPKALEAGALMTVPCGCRLVVRKKGKRCLHHIVEIMLDRVASFALRPTKEAAEAASSGAGLVDDTRLELVTSALRTRRSPN